jgi:Flp pilus assembly protein TadB
VNVTLLALLAGAGLGVGVLAVIAVLTGRTSTTGPVWPARVGAGLRSAWHGPHRSPLLRRRHQQRLVAAAVAAAVVWLVTGMPVAGLLIGLAIPGLPWLLGAGKVEQAAIARLEAVQSWTRRLKDIVDVGTGLHQAIVSSVDTVPAEIEDEVRDLAARLQAGHDPTDALYFFADALADEHADEVIAALIQHLSVRGARLGDVLVGIADAAAEQIVTRREVHAERANARFTLRFLTGLVVAEFALGALAPTYVTPYKSGVGQAVLLVASATFVALLVAARQASLPRRPTRLLARTPIEVAEAVIA